jgi:aldehyde dehydrogenase (NAD+)
MKDIGKMVGAQRRFFNSGKTLDVSFRTRQLGLLHHAVKENEKMITDALHADLRKTPYESYMTEIGIVLEDIRFYMKKTARWAKPRRVRTPFYHLPASSWIYPEPYGLSLIIAPWNYPFQLAIAPLAAAVSAGNCAMVKPSEFSVHTSEVMADLIKQYFDPEYIAVVTGAVETSKALLAEKFDKIFFTGSPGVGRIVMKAAADNLTPVTLELGGKSPCIVEADADIRLSAKRIVSGKFINAGQTCIAPDYLLVHHSVRDRLIDEIQGYIQRFFGENPANSPEYPRIINSRHLERLVGLMSGTTLICGGDYDPETLFLSPTLVGDVDGSHPVMQEEIFGPILPVISYDGIAEVIDMVNSRPRPLALYLFTGNHRTAETVLKRVSFGGGCVNDTLIHFATPYLPYGGVGKSGMGSYHGKFGFDAFTHHKGVMKNTFMIDFPFRYPPFFKHIKLLKKILR